MARQPRLRHVSTRPLRLPWRALHRSLPQHRARACPQGLWRRPARLRCAISSNGAAQPPAAVRLHDCLCVHAQRCGLRAARACARRADADCPLCASRNAARQVREERLEAAMEAPPKEKAAKKLGVATGVRGRRARGSGGGARGGTRRQAAAAAVLLRRLTALTRRRRAWPRRSPREALRERSSTSVRHSRSRRSSHARRSNVTSPVAHAQPLTRRLCARVQATSRTASTRSR
jgi:hypothetical protein